MYVKRILVTGAAGFIGFHTSLALKNYSNVELVLVDSLKPAFQSSMISIRTERPCKLGLIVEIVNIAKSSPTESIPIRIFRSNQLHRDFTPIKYVLDDMLFLAKIILDSDNEILNQIFEYTGSNTLNIGIDRPVSVETLFKTIENKLLKDAVVEIGEFIPEELKYTWSDNKKRNYFLLQRLELDFEETIGDLVDWYRDAD